MLLKEALENEENEGKLKLRFLWCQNGSNTTGLLPSRFNCAHEIIFWENCAPLYHHYSAAVTCTICLYYRVTNCYDLRLLEL